MESGPGRSYMLTRTPLESSARSIPTQRYFAGVKREIGGEVKGLAPQSGLNNLRVPRTFLQTGVKPSSASSLAARYDLDFADTRRGTDKSKGLRHFSTKVCEKVKDKGRTTYNEVADELVTEYFETSMCGPLGEVVDKQSYDMKNIRRRVYDALNVLLAMNIIEKHKKEIRWVGLPTSTAQEIRRLEDERISREERIREKTEMLQDMIIQLVAYKSLVERNRARERSEGRPAESAMIYLPFVVINTAKKAMVDCAVSADKSEFLFTFDHPFEIHDDTEVLKRMGLAHGLERGEVLPGLNEKVKNSLPPALRNYVDKIMDGSLVTSVRVAPMGQRPVQYVISRGSSSSAVSTEQQEDNQSRSGRIQQLRTSQTTQVATSATHSPSDAVMQQQAVTVPSRTILPRGVIVERSVSQPKFRPQPMHQPSESKIHMVGTNSVNTVNGRPVYRNPGTVATQNTQSRMVMSASAPQQQLPIMDDYGFEEYFDDYSMMDEDENMQYA